MDLTKIPLLETMRSRMSFLSSRQTVLADNVANANTPGYHAKDLEEPDFGAMVTGSVGGGTQLAMTDAHHISTADTGDVGAFTTRTMPDSEGTPNGNSVVLEDQMMKMSSVQMDYSTVTQLYRKALGMIRLAAGASR